MTKKHLHLIWLPVILLAAATAVYCRANDQVLASALATVAFCGAASRWAGKWIAADQAEFAAGNGKG